LKTLISKHSSRSNFILKIVVEQENKEIDELHLIDFTGSKQIGKTKTDENVRISCTLINKRFKLLHKLYQ
jgi:hypothetical protein